MTLKALLCNKYEFEINVSLKDESNKKRNEQSYLHFITSRQDLVSAKCIATEWLLEDVNVDREYSIREYFAGVGIQATLLQNMLNVTKHKVSDIDLECFNQLKEDKRWESLKEDGHKAILDNEYYDIKMLDFPHSSIIHLKRGKWSNFLASFICKPEIVCWTDTSMTYSIKIHGSNYSKELNISSLNSYSDYFKAMSDWLYGQVGYSIAKVAYRAKNAAYIKAIKGKHNLTEKSFPLDKSNPGFKIL
jgi:hypothetical protein